LCRKLELKPGDQLLEIGTGWGALAMHAAREYGANVTTTTISKEQYELARERIETAGLQDQITLLQCDYRELSGQYDKLVSIEMIEAVGHDYYPTFMRHCDQLLKPEGQALFQAITTTDQIYHSARKETDFIRRYIFPGGNLPSATHLLDVATAASQLRLFQLEDFSLDYARTLAEWRKRFWANAATVRAQGYSETFMRMWDYYLAICEAAFSEHHTSVVHMLFTKPRCIRGPATSINQLA
jgi:cyclopropane-fatty-acyl-phospholipid synthase